MRPTAGARRWMKSQLHKTPNKCIEETSHLEKDVFILLRNKVNGEENPAERFIIKPISGGKKLLDASSKNTRPNFKFKYEYKLLSQRTSK